MTTFQMCIRVNKDLSLNFQNVVESLAVTYSALLPYTIVTLPMNQHFLIKCKQYYRKTLFIVILICLHKTVI